MYNLIVPSRERGREGRRDEGRVIKVAYRSLLSLGIEGDT